MFIEMLIDSLGAASALALLGTAVVGAAAVLGALWHDDLRLRQRERGWR
ncbi:hypothetical protein [Azohydromonas sp.]|nr:hypothetical protein [Azohydromonas sp.]HMM86300.1 hypothetical protein [Azohydromonas sp.]